MANSRFKFTILNRVQVIAQLRAARFAVEETFDGNLERVGKDIMLISRSQFVPIRTGALMGSGRVEQRTGADGATVVEMAYGGPPDYAVNVHETNRNYRNGKSWKYLEIPAKEFPYDAVLTTRVRRELAGRIGGLTSSARAGNFLP